MTNDPLATVFQLVDSVVEVYLSTVIQPFLKFHEIFYNQLNVVLRTFMDTNKDKIPDWCTANFITYARTVLVVPCMIFISWGWYLLPSLIVLLVDFGDFLDGVAARFWIDVLKERQEKKEDGGDNNITKRPSSPTSDASFEFVSKGSPHVIEAWGVNHRAKTYGGFVDAVCDKAFVVPCWIMLLHQVANAGYFRWIQYFILFWLILAEVSSACIRFRAYYTSTGVASPKVEGFDFSTSAVKADHVGKAKQTFEMVGTALYVIPLTTYFGLALLSLAVPLAYESVRRKVKKRVMYVLADNDALDHKVIKFWMQAKGMGSKLIVGVTDPKKADMILNACSTACVDEVIAEAPAKADKKFLEQYDIAYVLSLSAQAPFVTDEVLHADCCLVIGDDAVVRPLKPKTEHTD
ncbi:expressed unknown protein [Seminavis robusta]|uniref:Uncharacterized protein n=1 Tax=Seminavis robusta TaxID=568900 RepID=A0A9N8EIQ5_9STRA|nr:expressed unknown protein [Seminavis robusta]|eukprot:Sro1019_g232020.1 n/a (406) ;mRNA; f:27829-29157